LNVQLDDASSEALTSFRENQNINTVDQSRVSDLISSCA